MGATSPASVSQPPLTTSEPARLAPAGEPIKRGRGRPRKRPAAQEPDAGAPQIRLQPSADSARQPPATAADQRWQPRVSLRRIDDPVRETPEMQVDASDGQRHRARQLQAPQTRAVTRSGRASRPPARLGLPGDVGY